VRASCPIAAAAYPCTVRLVSLLPSATEIVYALGLGEDLVGVTFECDEPPAARTEKTVVVGGRDTHGMTPGEIDSYVRTQMAAGADLYTLHAKALAELVPDLILTQDLCRGVRAAVRPGRKRPGLPGLPTKVDMNDASRPPVHAVLDPGG
jgi:ABC-type Fe3+-hydroxamate transport system substrate-binding protein